MEVMMRMRSVLGLAMVGVVVSGLMVPVRAEREALQQFVNSIESVDQVKGDLKGLLEQSDQCAVGSCFNFTRTAICERVAALDVQVNGQIIGDWTSVGSEGKLPISRSDLGLMKDIFSQCKPTNYQYWNFERMLHVYYVPTPVIDRRVRKALGVAEKVKGRDR
jgi:hypothetical protein